MNSAEIQKWLEGQTARIKEVAMDTEFAHINYSRLVPVTTEGSPWDTAVAFVSYTGVGKAEFISGNADDVPLADVMLGGKVAPIHMSAIGYAYGYDEINKARQLGSDLTAKKAIAARLAFEEHMQDVAFIGSVEKGLKGLFNQANADVSRGTDATNWGNADAEAALGLINKALALTGVKGRPTADTVLIPYTLYEKLAGLILGNGAFTGLEYVTKFNIAATQGRKVEVLGDVGLETAAANNKPRIVAYRRSPDVIELAMPMPHQFLSTYQAAPLRWEVPGVARVAGVNIANKRDFAYLDSAA